MPRGTSQDCWLHSEPRPLPPPASMGEPPHWQVGLARRLLGSLLLSPGARWAQDFAVPGLESVSVLWSRPAGLPSQAPWGFLLPLQDPQAGKPAVGLRTFTTLEGLLR